MIAVIQRVTRAHVEIDGKVHSQIEQGLLVLLGVKQGDTEEQLKYLAKKIVDLRIFSDNEGKMNWSVKDINAEIMIISQFTLCADNGKSGNRPSFIFAEKPEIALIMYNRMLNELKELYNESKIKSGIFAADMKIELLNDGPVTIILER